MKYDNSQQKSTTLLLGIVVFNMGESNNHIGKINNIEDQIIEIQTGRTQPFF